MPVPHQPTTQTMLCLNKSDRAVPPTRTHFYSGPKARKDLGDIRQMYADMCHGRSVSTSVIVRRALSLLASHLRGMAEIEAEQDRELAALVRHTNN